MSIHSYIYVELSVHTFAYSTDQQEVYECYFSMINRTEGHITALVAPFRPG